jgi:hypothetical protein
MSEQPTRDVFDVLTRDHRDLEATIWDLEWLASRGDDVQSLQADLIGRLLEHAWIEEHVLLRRLDGGDELDELVRGARVGHAMIEHQLAELASRSPGEPAWCAALSELRDAIAELVSVEEWRLYPEASKSLDDGEALELGVLAESLAAATPSEDVIELDDRELEAAYVG